MRNPAPVARWWFLALLTAVILVPLHAQDQKSKKVLYSIRYVKPDGASIRDSADFLAQELKALPANTKILVVDVPDGEWLETVYPEKGFVNRFLLYKEREFEEVYFNEVSKQTELALLASDKSPWKDILENPRGLLPFDPTRNWQPDERYKVKMVSASTLNLRFLPSALLDTIAQFRQGDKLITDTYYDGGGSWDRVVFPEYGFVHNEFLYSDSAIQQMFDDQKMAVWKVLDDITLTSIAEPESKDELEASRKMAGYSEVVSHGKQDFIVRESRQSLADSSIIIRWSDSVDLNHDGYPGSMSFSLQVNDAQIQDKFRARLFTRSALSEDYRPISLGKPYTIGEGRPTSWTIEGKDHQLEFGNYDFRVEILDDKTWELLSVQTPLTREELKGIRFDTEISRKMRYTILANISPYFIPVEGVFSRLGFPLGFNIELARESWRVAFGLGFNSMKAESDSKAFNLESKNIYLYGKYIPFRLVDDRLDIYVLAGVTNWSSRISNVKYPDYAEYYPTESNRGFHATAGLGSTFSVRNWLFGIQYQLFATPLAVFGGPLDEPETQEELNTWIPTNQYKLHTGSNQFQLVVGFRF